MSPFLLVGLLAAGAYVVSSKPKSSKSTKSLDCGCGKFRPFFKLSEDCTQILGIDPIYLDNPKNIKTDHNKIHSYINSKKKDFDIWKAAEDIVIQRYGEKCAKVSDQIWNFLYVQEFTNIARVLFLYDHIDCWNYDQLIFGDLWHWLKNNNLTFPYQDGKEIKLVNDFLTNEQLIQIVLLNFNWYPESKNKNSECLAIPLLFGDYMINKPDIFMYDYNLNPMETKARWDRYVGIVNTAKELAKKGNKK